MNLIYMNICWIGIWLFQVEVKKGRYICVSLWNINEEHDEPFRYFVDLLQDISHVNPS